MRAFRFFFFTSTFFFVLWGGTDYFLLKRQSVEQMDAEIEQLQEMKRGFEAKALRHEDQATYLQFDSQAFLETRRHIQLAEENRRKAALVQDQIDILEKKKKSLQG